MGRSFRPGDKGGGGQSPKNIVWPFGPQSRLKIRGGGGAGPPEVPSLDLPLLFTLHGKAGFSIFPGTFLKTIILFSSHNNLFLRICKANKSVLNIILKRR